MASIVVVCPGCGLEAPGAGVDPDPRYNASGECRALMNEMSGYTLAHGSTRFIHQHLVDAYGAQHVRSSGSTVGAAFTLAGLYLAVERAFTGRQVQLMHIRMAKHTKTWPRFTPPTEMGRLTIADVFAAEPGDHRDNALMSWCASVWAAWLPEQQRVREMIDRFL